MKTGYNIFLAHCLAMTIMSNSLTTNAAGPPTDPAHVLFEEGVTLLMQGQFDKACPKFEQSLAISNKAASWFAFADCNMQWGRHAEAMVAYDAYLVAYDKLPANTKAGHAKRVEQARAKKEELRGLVASVTIDALGIKGFDVFIDDQRRGVGDSTFEFSPLNPGEHHIVVLIPGRPAHDTKVILKKGEKRHIEITSPSASGAISGNTTGQRQEPLVVVQTDSSRRPSGMRIGGFIAIGIGATALLTSSITTALMMSNIETIEEDCKSVPASTIVNCKTNSGIEAGNDAIKNANLSTIGFSVGAASILLGTVLVVAGKRKTELHRNSSAMITGRIGVEPSGIGISLSGSW